MKNKSNERFREIIKVFSYYGFVSIFDSKVKRHEKSPENLRKAFEELGSTFIKIGQILSTRTDILPKEYINELIKLQDSAAEENFQDMKKVFEQSLCKKIGDCFIYFDEKPIASASIAQVYRAITLDGQHVVVKIQRPDIYEKIKIDIAILRRLIKFTNIFADIKFVDPLQVLQEIDTATEKELDFVNEAENAKLFKEKNKDVPVIRVPKVIKELQSKKVLTLEQIDGVKVNEINKLIELGYDSKDIAKKLALCYCKQIFQDGFFHGDPHPGNILICEGKICFIDFGIVGTFENSLKSWLNKAMFYVATNDKKKLLQFVLAVGIKRGKIDIGKLYEDISYIFDMYINTSLKNIKMATLIEEIIMVANKNNIQVPRELILLVKTLVILEGVLAEIDPEVDIASVLLSYIKNKNKFIFFDEFKGEELFLNAYSFFRDGSRIPSKFIETLDSLSNGRSKINLQIIDLDKALNDIHHMVNRLTGGILVAALVLSSSLILVNDVGPKYQNLSLIGLCGYGISSILGLLLVIKMIKAGSFRNNKKKNS